MCIQTTDIPLEVCHFRFLEWPDEEAPRDTFAVREIFKRLCDFPSSKGPIVVHCRFILSFTFIFSLKFLQSI
ncbi:putative protein-tyrosine-phosphatase [Helianthus debilis subsp. tardiflorus]